MPMMRRGRRRKGLALSSGAPQTNKEVWKKQRPRMTRRMMKRKGWALSGGWRHYGAAGWMDRRANATALFISHLIVIKLLSWLQVLLKLLLLRPFDCHQVVVGSQPPNFAKKSVLPNLLKSRLLGIVQLCIWQFIEMFWFTKPAQNSVLRSPFPGQVCTKWKRKDKKDEINKT